LGIGWVLVREILGLGFGYGIGVCWCRRIGEVLLSRCARRVEIWMVYGAFVFGD